MKGFIKELVVAALIAFLIMQFVKPTIVKESSMQPTLFENNYIFLSKQSYSFGDPKRGDIIVFHTNLTTQKGEEKLLIKRIIGLPGDKISIMEGEVFINDEKQDEEYILDEVIEAGIVVTSTEIKSVRQGKVNLKESYAKIENGELIIYGMHISPYEQGNRFNVDPVRPRKLLLHKQEIRKINGYTTLKGLSIVPLNMYLNEQGMAKLEIAVARGKKEHDKRETTAKKDADRKIQQAVKSYAKQY